MFNGLFRSKSRGPWGGWVVIATLLPGVSSCHGDPEPPTATALLREAEIALAAEDFDRARQLADQVPEDAAEWGMAQLVAGEAATRNGHFEEALLYYLSVNDGNAEPDTAALAVFSAAEVYRELGRLALAEQAYRAVLIAEPENMVTHARLAFLLSATGRRWEALPHYLVLVKSGTATVEELVLCGDVERPVEQHDYLLECAAKAPDDVAIQLGLAAHAFWEEGAADSEKQLRDVVEASPELMSGQAMLGELLVDRGDQEFLAWHHALPSEGADAHPEIWYVRGLWARRHDQLDVAAHCFWRALRLVPIHRRAMYQLAQTLVALRETGAPEFTERASQLVRLSQTLDDVLRSNGEREAPLRQTAELLEEMGRIWEACAWGVVALRRFPDASWPHELFARRSSMLQDDLPLSVDAENLARRYDLSEFTRFEDFFRDFRITTSSDGTPGGDSDIRFSQEATLLDFVYFNSDDPATKGVRMLEVNGGGVAVLDFDRDGWPDLYFTQGAEWDHGDDSATPTETYTDRLFRNLSLSFNDATSDAFGPQMANRGYGQGCAVADFNNDGFPDLYVANIGLNHLYVNNGDGTFSDVSNAAGLNREQWTASCVVVDVNADGFPDLYDVNYLEGDGIFRALCHGRACSPVSFRGARDRLLLSQGDATFEEVAAATPPEGGKGLGIVTAGFDDMGQPLLFISNDQVANFLLRVRPTHDPVNSIQLFDEAFVCGLAYNEDGIALACMGIAADDFNSDGRLDLFVTNFHDESNTLYRQDAPGLYVDSSKSTGIPAASYPSVGWGTQFLDADLDGHPDLVLTNGHVDDYTDEGGEYHMRPQFFRNQGDGRFVEFFADQDDPYFGRKFLGRGLARLDWNRDGLMDFVVSNIGDRASLVTNRTQRPGHFLNVQLHASQTARDAIGTRVRVRADGRSWTRFLLAGDGFQASNERKVQFGLGGAEIVNELEILWPSGRLMLLHELPVDVTIELVESGSVGTLWRSTEPSSISVQ